MAIEGQDFPYRHLPPITIAPTEEASCMFFDKEGMMWVGTNAGVKSYDGYHVRTYKTNAYQPASCPTIRSVLLPKIMKIISGWEHATVW